MKKKSVTAWLLILCLIIGLLPMNAFADGEETEEVEMTTLIDWVLTDGFDEDGKLCNYEVSEDVVVLTVDEEFNEVETECSDEVLAGNFVALYDVDDDEVVDCIYMIAYDMAPMVWDEDMYWCDDAGAADPGIPDEIAYEVFAGEQVIPYGQRLFDGIGVGEWSGTVDFWNAEDSSYWTDNDYYNMESSETLTMLTGYKTQLQPTGWTCGLCSAIGVLEWFDVRNGLNPYDLANLRKADAWACGTTIEHMDNIFAALTDLGLTPEWETFSSADDNYALFDSEWVQSELAAGHPIMVMWNAFGWHWQTIIGYDNMGTETTQDDVLIMMDPYDTTDHDANGYELESYERLIYGVCGDHDDEPTNTQFYVAYPVEDEEVADEDAEAEDEEVVDEDAEAEDEEIVDEDAEAEDEEIVDEDAEAEDEEVVDEDAEAEDEEIVDEDAEAEDEEVVDEDAETEDEESEVDLFTDDNKIPYGSTSDDIDTYYPETEYRGENGLAGAATGGYERAGDHADSPYWVHLDFYNMEDTDTLHILENFSTIQQATEWTCGLASSLMVMNWFDMAEGETDVHLSAIRQDGEVGATYLEGMKEVFTYMNETYGQDWVWISTDDLDDPDGEESYIGDYCLQAGTDEDWYGLIPYLLDNGIPMMIGSDEWGGHWQVIIGYDDMGTVDRTEDDVIILADPYDTTDHNQDGYVIDGFERLVYGWYSAFEPVYGHNDFIAAFPLSQYEDVAAELGLTE